MLSSAHHLWPFACDIYKQSTVSSTCLQLQDQYQINVPLLLFCCWSGWRYGELSQQQLQQAIDFSHDCASSVTEPLRVIRQHMKTRLPPSIKKPINSSASVLTEASWAQLREQVKGLELASEKFILDGLNQLMDQQVVVEGSARHAMLNMKSCFHIKDDSSAILLSTLVSEVFEVPSDKLDLSLRQ